MDENRKNTLKPLCTENNIVHQTYYGTTHRAQFRVGGEVKAWDILHIELPFNPLKEAEFMRRFDVSREDLGDFYKDFSKAVLNHILVDKAILSHPDRDKLKMSVVEYKAVQTYKRYNKDGVQTGTDIYLISEPMMPFVNAETFKSNGASLKAINQLALRLLQTIKSLNDRGMTMGAIDLDSYYLTSDESGKNYLKSGYFFYGTAPAARPETYTADVAQFIKSSVVLGEETQSYDTDIHMLCAMLWTLYSGKHYTEPANMSEPPKYASPEIAAALADGIENGAAAYKKLNTALRTTNKQIDAGNMPNEFIAFDEPSYIENPLPELREEETEEEETPEVEEDQQTEKKRKPRKGALIFIAAALIALTAGLYIPVRSLIANRQKAVPEAQPTPVVADDTMSAEMDLYVLHGKVVTREGQEMSTFEIDENGDMIYLASRSSSDGRAKMFDKAHCSPYVYIENASVSILSKDFSVNENEGYLLFRDNVVDLRGEDVRFRTDGKTTEISAELIERYGITEASTLVMLTDEKQEKTIFAFIRTMPSPDGPDTKQYFAIRNDSISQRELQIVKGEWIYEIQIHVDPEQITNRRVTLSTDDAEHLLFIAGTGEAATRAKAVKTSIDKNGLASATVYGMLEGKFTFTLKSDDGLFEKRFALSFVPDASVMPEPEPEPEPEPSDEPVAEPGMTDESGVNIDDTDPTPAPTPKPTSTQSPWPSQPQVTIISPSTPAPDPDPDPDPYTEPYTPDEPDDYTPTFTIDKDHITLSVGQTELLYPSESFIIYKTEPLGIIEAEQISGTVSVKGVKKGTCQLILYCTDARIKGQTVTVYITVK